MIFRCNVPVSRHITPMELKHIYNKAWEQFAEEAVMPKIDIPEDGLLTIDFELNINTSFERERRM